MYAFLSKLLPLFVLPLGVTLILLIAGIVTRRRRWLIAAGTVLYLTSIPVLSAFLSRTLETGYVRLAASDAPVADAIVVLSTGRSIAPGQAAVSEWSDADRFFGGVELFQAGKAPLLIFTGGWFPFAPTAPLEGDVLAQYARGFGVPAESILTTGRVINTFEESQAVAHLLSEAAPAARRILLVTSAFHMDRATLHFERAGLSVTAFPVDFRGSQANTVSLLDFVPTGVALVENQVAIREIYGRIFAKLFGR